VELFEAIKTGDLGACKEAIAAGAAVNELDQNGWTPLNWAAGKGHLEIVKLLVQHGADVLKVGRDLRTPFMIALAASQAETAKFLRDAEAAVPGDRPPRAVRQYCLALHVGELRQFAGWRSPDQNGDGAVEPLPDSQIVYLHQDYGVTKSIWRDRDVIFEQVTPQWKEFCDEVLRFKVPDDLDLIVSSQSKAEAEAAIHAQPAPA